MTAGKGSLALLDTKGCDPQVENTAQSTEVMFNYITGMGFLLLDLVAC